MNELTIVIPAKNEAGGLGRLLPDLVAAFPDATIIVVDDASSDETADIGRRHGARVVSHPYSMGNGAAVKTGVRATETELLVLMDGDGQHAAEDVARLLDKLGDGFDMVVGARAWGSQANAARGVANTIYSGLASWMVGHRIPDVTSGFRAVRTDKFKQFLYLLPNGFSYPTTITMAFFRAGYRLAYVPITAPRRQGRSHIAPLKDGVRFFLIIFRVGTLYSPLKLFMPISVLFFLIGTSYYLYTFISDHRFTNMSALLLVTAVLVFLIGLVSEQITSLIYSRTER